MINGLAHRPVYSMVFGCSCHTLWCEDSGRYNTLTSTLIRQSTGVYGVGAMLRYQRRSRRVKQKGRYASRACSESTDLYYKRPSETEFDERDQACRRRPSAGGIGH